MPTPLRFILFTAAALASSALYAADFIVEKSFASAADFEPFFRDGSIDLQSAPGAITLRREVILPPPMGNKLTGDINESTPITPARQARKTFNLPDDHNGMAEIFAFPGGTGTALVNGASVTFEPLPPPSGWTRAEIPATLLRAGLNEVVFTNGFALSQDRESKPETSFFSTDSGKSWKPAEGGEFLISLRVRRYPPKGMIVSPVIDTAVTGTVESIAPLIKIRSLTVQWRAIVPGSGSVTIEARSGNTLWPDETWSPWAAVERVLPARYVQARASIVAGAGDVAPSLARLSVTARGETAATADSQGCVLRDYRNPPLVRNSQPYAFQRPSEKLARLRAQFKLDEVIAGGQTDLDKALLLRNWVRPRTDTTFEQCALALGFNARPVFLAGHAAADMWCKELGKWVLMDGETNLTDAVPLYDLTADTTPFARRTDRAGDIAWTVHTPRLEITATETPGVLTVWADTVTPNLKTFRFAASGKEPVLLPGDGTDPDSRRALFTWRLAPGLNTLSVTSLNRFDREGRAATASVEWKPQP